ncbi:MAG: filamentous hemagglutinin N-terminal domain-containing protein [Methylacidiphilales bacterium]|nr:filamentous hemagglutinin N-terminal domain-containing protein [Candidatus Methylacidiphilales bacterium]
MRGLFRNAFMSNNMIFALWCLMTLGINAQASPVLDNVADGTINVSTSINSSGSTDTTIVQTTNQATVSWRTFDIQATESVRFTQPSANAIIFNNITSENPTQILGTIVANGRVVLRNANGFYFGVNSSVSAHTFIAIAANETTAAWSAVSNSVNITNYAGLTGNITALGSFNNTQTFLVGKKIEITSSARVQTPSNQSALFSIRANSDIKISGAVIHPRGVIDIFSNSGELQVTSSATLSGGQVSVSANNNVEIAPIVSVTNSLAVTSANGSVGSSIVPLRVELGTIALTSENLKVSAIGGNIFLATANASQTVNQLLNTSITISNSSVLSLTQTNGDLVLNTAFTQRRNVNLELFALDGNIYGSVPISAQALTLVAYKNIGNPNGTPISVDVDGATLIAESRIGNISLEHQKDIGSLFAGTLSVINNGVIKLSQTYGTVVVKNSVTIAAQLLIESKQGNIIISSPITVNALTLSAPYGAITASNSIISPNVTLRSGGAIGTSRDPISLIAFDYDAVIFTKIEIIQPRGQFSYVQFESDASRLFSLIKKSPGTTMRVTQQIDQTVIEKFISIPKKKDDTFFVQLFNIALSVLGTDCDDTADDFVSFFEQACRNF